jgi:hypothetical protein
LDHFVGDLEVRLLGIRCAHISAQAMPEAGIDDSADGWSVRYNTG